MQQTPSQMRHFPTTILEAYACIDANLWKSVVEDELLTLNANYVYDTIQIPKGVTLITSKPVFYITCDQDRKIEWYKVRIVAWGFTQKEGVDYQKVFAPIANLDSIWIIISIAAKHNLELDQMDVSTVHLNEELIEELYLQPSEGIPIQLGYC